MPRLFNDLTSDTPANVYAGAPVEEAKALNSVASEQYKTSRNAKDALDVMANNLDVEDRNFEIKKRVIDETKAKFKDLTKNGNYQDAQYLIQNVTKDLATDNELQGAIKSRQKEQAYYGGLKEQLDKGEINNDIFNYAVEKSKQGNRDKIAYDPNTMTVKNMFNGQGVVKDLSKEIYNAMDARLTNWKEESISDINGNQYKKTAASPTGYFNMTTGKQVTANEVHDALRTELENTGEYKDFLNQEKAIDYHKTFKNPDGSYRPITKEDINGLGLSDDKLKTIVSGVSQDTLDSLARDKSKKGQEAYQKQLDIRNSITPANLSQENLNKLYDMGYSQKQTEKYISPATAKGSYRTWDDKYLENIYGLENLKHQHKLAEDKAKEGMPITAAPENVSQLQQYKLGDIKAQNRTLSDIKTEMEQLQGQLPTATESTKKEIYQRLQVLTNKTNIINKNNSSFEDDMRNKGYNPDKAYAQFLGDSSADPRTQTGMAKEYRSKLINNLLSLPANQISTSLAANLHVMKNNLNRPDGMTIDPSMSMEEIINEINKYPEAKKVYDNLKGNILERAATEGGKASMIADKGYSELASLSDDVASQKVNFLEKEKTKSISTNFIGIDEDNNNNPKDDTSNKINREVRDQIKSLATNPSSEFTTESGISTYDIAAGKVDGYNLVDKEGKAAKADLTKSKVNITSQSIGGKVPVGITFCDSEGHALYFDDSNKGQATVLAYPKNDNVTIDGLKRIGNNYLQNGKSSADKLKGIQYLANAEYKTQLDGQIAPDFWTDKPKGYAEDVVLNIQGQPTQLKVTKENTGEGQTEFSISGINDDKPQTFYNIDGKPITTFKNLEQAATVLYYNQNQEEIKPFIK